MKKFLINILYWLQINFFLFPFHFLTLMGLAFNDSDAHYDTIIESLPYLRNGLFLIVLTSIGIVFFYRKKELVPFFRFLVKIFFYFVYHIHNC